MEFRRVLFRSRLARGLNADKLHKLSTLLASPDQRDFYRQLSSHWSAPEALVRDASEESTPLTTPGALPHTDSFEHDMMADRAEIGRAASRERGGQNV